MGNNNHNNKPSNNNQSSRNGTNQSRSRVYNADDADEGDFYDDYHGEHIEDDQPNDDQQCSYTAEFDAIYMADDQQQPYDEQ